MLTKVIEKHYPAARWEAFGSNYVLEHVLQEDGTTKPTITAWDEDSIGAPMPSEAELLSFAEEAAVEELRAYAAARRYAVEIGGIEIAGRRIQTDRESQAMITGAYNLVVAFPQSVQFKAANGFTTLAPEDVTDIAIAVGQHVQICFAKEAEVLEGIETGTITTKEQIDEAFADL